jgi:hypothetical protein
MSKVLSFAFWNVEQFQGKRERVERVVGLLTEHDPDVFAIFEVKGRDVFSALMSRMPSHSFTITESTSSIEILVGVRRSIPYFVTQRDELQSKVPTLRPGALATLRHDNGEDYVFLFLHPKSFESPRDWDLSECRRAQDVKRDSQSPFRLALGDSLYMPGFAPLRDSGYSTTRLRHCPYDEWLDGVSDVLAYRLRGSRTFGPYATAAIRTHLPLSRTTRLVLRTSVAGSA